MLWRKLEIPRVAAKGARGLLMGLRRQMRRLLAGEMAFSGCGKYSKHVIELMPSAIAKWQLCAG